MSDRSGTPRQGGGTPTGGSAGSPPGPQPAAADEPLLVVPQPSTPRGRAATDVTDAISALSTDVRSHGGRDGSDGSMSGYSGQREDGATSYAHYYNRLTRFYMKYNPDKLDRVEEFLKAYRGEEEQLFALLSQKYGPEPDAPGRGGSIASMSDLPGPRMIVPKVVPREVGFTDDDTPYWPGSKTVNDRDLCDVLETAQAANPDLAPVFLGALKEHPTIARNGMTYISPTPVPSDGSRFLGHLWAGTLANNKVLVHKGVQYHRTVLHCTEQCSTNELPHERWRLTMYRAEHTPNVLFRTVWDPIIRLDPPRFEGSANGSATRGGFRVQYATRRRPPSDGGSGHGGAGGGGSGASPQLQGRSEPPPAFSPHPDVARQMGLPPPGAGGYAPGLHVDVNNHSFGDGASSGGMPPSYQQPQQPMSLGPIEILVNHMQQLEQRLNARLHSMEERLMNIETALLEPDQPDQ